MALVILVQSYIFITSELETFSERDTLIRQDDGPRYLSGDTFLGVTRPRAQQEPLKPFTDLSIRTIFIC